MKRCGLPQINNANALAWRTGEIPPNEGERFSSGLANSPDPPDHEKTAAPAGTRRDGDIKGSDPEHNTYEHLNQPVLLLHLSGSTVASFTIGDARHVVDVPRGGVVCTAARKMLALGVDPAEQVDVRRDGKPVFTRCLTVETWAGLTVSEDGDRGARFRPYRGAHAAHSANSALRVSDPSEDETRLQAPSVRGVG